MPALPYHTLLSALHKQLQHPTDLQPSRSDCPSPPAAPGRISALLASCAWPTAPHRYRRTEISAPSGQSVTCLPITTRDCYREPSSILSSPPNPDPGEVVTPGDSLRKEGGDSKVVFMPKAFLVSQFTPVPDCCALIAVLMPVRRATTAARCQSGFAPLMNIYHRCLQPACHLSDTPLQGSLVPPELCSSIIHLIAWGNLLIKH